MADDLQRKRLFQEVKRSLERRCVDRALEIAHDYYNAYNHFSHSELLLLSIAFSASDRSSAKLAVQDKMSAHLLWQKATSQMTPLHEIEAAKHGIWLAEIYLHRREIDLAWSALHAVKTYVTHGPVARRYSLAVDMYESRRVKSDPKKSDSNLRIE